MLYSCTEGVFGVIIARRSVCVQHLYNQTLLRHKLGFCALFFRCMLSCIKNIYIIKNKKAAFTVAPKTIQSLKLNYMSAYKISIQETCASKRCWSFSLNVTLTDWQTALHSFTTIYYYFHISYSSLRYVKCFDWRKKYIYVTTLLRRVCHKNIRLFLYILFIYVFLFTCVYKINLNLNYNF